MVEVKPFRLGVVEGFFGKSWSWEARAQYAQFLSGNGFTTYLYAPKNDNYFRKRWMQPCPTEHLVSLISLSSHYKGAGVEFAIGLSPFELYLNFSAAGQDALARKIEEINAINPDTLCILFDDMKGAVPSLASQQLRIMDQVTRQSNARHFIFCPTYYSDDPILARHFGEMPADYLEELGSHLDSRLDIFWTGQQVFSTQYPEEHLLDVAERLHRKPLLWDNYPVNDSEKLAGRLHLSPFKNRDTELKPLAQGLLANPMNQPRLSQLPLYSLGKLFQGEDVDLEDILHEACTVLSPKKLGKILYEDSALFQDAGLEGISTEQKSALIKRYSAFQDHPMVIELMDWLNGEYAFDPQCLT